MHKTGTIYGINGPVIYLKGNTGFQMAEMVYVGKERLVGEVIRLTNDITTIQVFEETTGLRPGDPVEATGDAISVTLGPGILNNIFDGIERPLSEIAKSSGKYISRGVSVDSLDTEKKWQTHITVKPGEFVSGGTIIAEVQETQAIVHKSMVPPNISGTVLEVAMDGEYTINEPIVTVQLANGKEEKLTLAQKWPIPASIYGLLLMLAGLMTKVIKLEQVKIAADFLIEIMPPMFIPAAVGLIVTWSDLKVILVPVLVITCITTVFVMVVTGRTAQAVMHLKENMAAQKMEKQD